MRELSDIIRPGDTFDVRVKPGARNNQVIVEGNEILVNVTAAPDKGKANKAVQTLLAKALGVAKSRLVLVHGATSRSKVFRFD